ncbi:hypothetical protein BOTBODRAFT_26817 [Botryobasidium botryosum FD-172 SS1]|uniref:Uncharacterized protein n=1 Tax=Botryobasidium botryosum (strain FD-172 SS1) TaxID=930990 RepID=A0A067N9M6_BOTB1|nr:hypothetical protein BOTBODRAFT_26817 [Botryobasidium botryosum FD-172 SS1]
MKAAARLIVWEPLRMDYTNDAICDATIAHLRRHSKTNDFSDFFKSASSTRMKALNTQLGKDASYVKGLLKDLIRAGVHPEYGLTSLTDSVTEGMRSFTGSSNGASAQHAIHVLILRAFARANLHLLKESTKLNPGPPNFAAGDSEPLQPPANAEPRPKKRRRTRGTDFFSKLTEYFEEKEKEWGTDTATGEWAKYIDDALNTERRIHPNDMVSIIPARSSGDHALNSAPANADVMSGQAPRASTSSGASLTPSHVSQFSALFTMGGTSG